MNKRNQALAVPSQSLNISGASRADGSRLESALVSIKDAPLSSPHESYDRLVDASPQGVLFCHSWWLDAVAPGRYEILTVNNNGELKAAWPVVFRENARRPEIVMPKMTQKLGILFAPNDSKYAERLSDEHRLTDILLEKLPVDCSVDQRFHENFKNWLPFYWAGFQQATWYTYLLEDLSDVDTLWHNLRTNARRLIRKALKEGIRIQETNDLECFYALNSKTFARQGMETPFSLDLLSRIDAAASRHAGRKAFIAYDQAGRPHACEYLVYDKNCAISLLRGNDPELRASGAGTLLQWESIRFASSVSRKFDFEGSMHRSVEAYIREFGAHQAPYFRITRKTKNSKSSRVARVAGRALRRLARIIDAH